MLSSPRTYTAFTFWSIMTDREMVRLSMPDNHGREFFMIIPHEPGKHYREARDEALDAIMEAMSLGCDPGEVRIMESVGEAA